MPAVRGESGRRGMISRNDEDVGLEFHKQGNQLIHLFNHCDLRVKIPIFTPGIRRFNMKEEEIVFIVMVTKSDKLFLYG
jgi:hypothetical protein